MSDKLVIDTVIFDMDGTLLDTEKYFRVFWRKAAAHFGYEMSDEQALFMRSMGKPFAPKQFIEWFGEDCNYDEIRSYRRKIMQEQLTYDGTSLKKGVLEALKWLKENHYRIALCTATPTDRAVEQLKETQIFDFFDEIVSATEVERGKPAPDPYLYALSKIGKKPDQCYAVEDAPNGIKSAYAAGLSVIMVPDQTEPDEELRKLLTACIPDMSELSVVVGS